MAAEFSAVDDFLASLATISTVGVSLSQPPALRPSQLPITNAVSCGCVVLLCGYFESFLRSVIREYITKINSLGLPLSKIPEEMQAQHFAGGADALAHAVRRDKGVPMNPVSQDLARRLASLSNPTGYTLAWEAFANTKSNPGTKLVAGLLKELRISGGWTTINSLVTEHGRLDTFLSTFLEMRNVCAHTGAHGSPPSGMDICDYTLRFAAIAECIDMMLALQIEEFCQT